MAKQDDEDDYFDESNSIEETYGNNPPDMDTDTFRQRNDPSILLERYRLQLMNAYKVVEKAEQKDGTTKLIYKIKRKKNTKPKANKQGVEDIISYVEKFVNSHTVQGNFPSLDEFRIRMRYISNDVTIHFLAMRKTWNIDMNEIDSVISNAINFIDIFLTRTLFNEERIRYGESFKETTSRDIKPERKENMFQKAGSFLLGRRR